MIYCKIITKQQTIKTRDLLLKIDQILIQTIPNPQNKQNLLHLAKTVFSLDTVYSWRPSLYVLAKKT